MAACSEEAAGRHIERIARARQDGSDELKDSLAGAIERVTMMFPQTGHFLMEFLQNADDAGSRSVLVELAPDAVRIANDGTPFSEADVESICRVGRSAKKATDYIGYLGIGFKSVFLFCDSPRIVSGCYRFAFDRQHWPQPEKVPWQITPVWLEQAPEWTKELSSYTTFFELPIRERDRAAIAERLVEEIEPDSLSGRVLLFLGHVEELVLKDRLRGSRRVVRRRRVEPGGAEPGPYERYEIAEERDGEATHESWVVFRSTVRMPEDVRSDPETERWERREVAAREIAVAFALDEEGQLRRVSGTAHMGVFSFLPLKEVPSGLSFLVQGDFLTGPGRESIRRDARWNRWIAGELFRFITGRVVPVLLEHEQWRYVAALVLYPGGGGPDVINDELLRPLRRYVEERPLLVAADGSLITAAQAMRIPNWDAEWLRVLGVQKLESAFPGKRALHRHALPPPLPITEGPFVNSKHWPWAMEQLVEARAKGQDVEFFRALYRELGRYSEGTIRSAPWFSARLVLAEDGSLVSASGAYWAEQGPPVLRGRRRVHPGVFADPECAWFLEFLGCRVLTAQQVREWQLGDSLEQVTQAWATMPERERMEWTGRFFRLWREGVLDVGRLGFLTVKSRDGRWRSPPEVFFGEAYAPEHRLEALAARGRLRVEPEEMPLLSEAYLAAGDGGEVSEWRRFFQALGVDRRLEDERLRETFAERVAEEVLVRYERSRGRQPVRVPRSQERGYDFESGGRRIELKGRSRPDPPIDLTRTQYQALSDDAYYVYVVADALRHPVLYVLRGPKLLGLLPDPTFRYGDWRKIATPRWRRTERRAMPSRAELEEAVRSYASEQRPSVVEALYVLSLCAGEWLAKANLRLRYPPVEAAESLKEAVGVLGRIGALDAQGAVVWDKTTDTQEPCRDVVRWACEAHLAGLQEVVEGRCADLSRRGRQLAFLLLREGSVRTGEVYDAGATFAAAHRIVFSEELLPEAFDELVSVGLLYRAFYGTKFVVPGFARRAWEYRLEQVARLPRLQ
ncbi:MAG: DUF3883 domain-containing protein [Bacillota bacterium]